MWELLIVFCYRALHWVTIEMLCVPVDEEIPVVSDSVVKAITGKSQASLIFQKAFVIMAEIQ